MINQYAGTASFIMITVCLMVISYLVGQIVASKKMESKLSAIIKKLTEDYRKSVSPPPPPTVPNRPKTKLHLFRTDRSQK